ncbi:riboflavin synthase [Enterococcus mundtii]|uniref:Riboflavin synthase n=1 Tax=Enterococcus mundtii TaxID=53346 RepID=A0ABQ0VGM4_ENTMU|nr:riboflavin synthase [Enterococcus mundtii]EMF0110793.1 riboflavin synthase [Enterococcus hirae]MZU11601.1 riboflavin synthase [Bifidobacterium longum]GEN18505.1 riboflavin synthase subunit alpha [Ligilactobacillus acidipiscis]AUB54457.1 riboflavin synthase subunit alpha [Enterococcus mundtii]MDB7088307.1 riboflavin synthase [Enterococcus mundtii]
MFTGLIIEQGTVKEIRRSQQMIQLTFQASNSVLRDYKIGDSMAVNGVCLTAIETSSTFFRAEIMPETFKRTTISTLKVGDRVNLERAVSMMQRFEGHFVAGHIDTVTRLIKKIENQNALVLTFAYPTKYAGEIIPQGSIAINGVSLTVTDTTIASFSVSLIPHSKSLTNLGNLGVGHLVNIETDIIGKYVKAQRNKFEMYKEKDLL